MPTQRLSSLSLVGMLQLPCTGSGPTGTVGPELRRRKARNGPGSEGGGINATIRKPLRQRTGHPPWSPMRPATPGGGTTTDEAPILTTDRVEFETAIKVGDLLLFDSLHLLSQFLQLADDRPINHCAVYLGGSQVAHCNKPRPDDPDHAVYSVALFDLLDLARVRTVTAFRHRRVDGGASPEPVVTRAHGFLNASVPYAYVDLARLAAPCLLRAYQYELATDHASAVIALLRSAVAMTSVYDRSKKLLSRKRSTPVGMTCSSFAYRCYVGDPGVRGNDGLPVVLTAPLATLDAPVDLGTAALAVEGRQPRLGPPGASVIEGLRFHPALDDAPANGDFAAPKGRWVDDILTRRATARNGVIELMRTSRPAGHQLPSGPVDAAVTPRDLWGSASFRPVALFHRLPAGPADEQAIDLPD